MTGAPSPERWAIDISLVLNAVLGKTASIPPRGISELTTVGFEGFEGGEGGARSQRSL